MKREEIKSIITENKLEDAVSELLKLIPKPNISDKEWLSVFENPPEVLEGNVMSKEFLCCDKHNSKLVASLFKKGDTYTGYQRNGGCMFDVRYYMELPENPNSK